MPPERDDPNAMDQAIDRFWDQITQGRPANAGGLDPADAATIRHLQSADDRPTPAPAFAKQLREELMHAHALPVSSQAGPGLFSNGRTYHAPRLAIPPATPPGARHWAFPRLLAAVMLLVAIGAGVFSYRALWPDDPGKPRTLPAVVTFQGTPSPSTETGQTLLSVELPAEGLPSGEQVMGGLNHQTLPAGVIATWGPEQGRCCPGIRVDYVVSGNYTAVSSVAAHVIRAGSAIAEPILAGEEIELGPGDATVFQNDSTITYENTGADPVEMLFWILYDETNGTYSTDPIPAGAVMHDSDVQFSLPFLPAGPAKLEIHLVELEPSARLALPDGGIQFAVSLATDDAGTPLPTNNLGNQSDGTIVNVGSVPVTAYLLTYVPSGS